MDVESFSIPGLKLIKPRKFGDDRGFFSETFNQLVFESHVPNTVFVQDNHSLSAKRGTLRGLHFQLPPFDQGKLVRVTRGKVLDIAVDIRTGSPTFGEHVSVELSSENWHQLWIPPGFAHAFLTLEDATEFCYKVTNYYAPAFDSGFRFDDPTFNIDWGMDHGEMTLSDKDKHLGYFSEFISPFQYCE